MEQLESRWLPSTTAVPEAIVGAMPDGYNASSAFSPSQIRSAYGINAINLSGTIGNGAGQTIAIVDAYNDPTIAKDLAAFDSAFGLPAPSFRVLNQHGQTSNLPPTDGSGAWQLEEALDVEWAHAVAPAASIVLVEAASNSASDLFTAVMTASHIKGVSVVSMSWGFSGGFSTETAFDSDFNVAGVTFVAATGDTGANGSYPAQSPLVVAVGGTALSLSGGSKYASESGWSLSNGGISPYESRPSFQNGVSSVVGSKRGTPDVAFDASFSTGVVIYDSAAVADYGTPWLPVGGTSIGAPAWSGLIAIADQGRAKSGLAPLSSSQTLATLYSLPSADFHDIKNGSNSGYSSRAGYDLVTGLGTPVANLLVPGLMALSNAKVSGASTAKGTAAASESAVSAASVALLEEMSGGANPDEGAPTGWAIAEQVACDKPAPNGAIAPAVSGGTVSAASSLEHDSSLARYIGSRFSLPLEDAEPGS